MFIVLIFDGFYCAKAMFSVGSCMKVNKVSGYMKLAFDGKPPSWKNQRELI